MRHGIAPDGSNYFPVFPYLYYNRVNTEDLLAIKAYLDVIPAIPEPNRAHDVGFPFNVRFLQYFWKILFYYPYAGVFKPDVSKTEKWNRGAYLVEGLAHCGMCHTPINFLGGPKRHLAFTGNIIDGWKAPNITGTNLQKVTEGDLVRLFIYDERISGQGKLSEDSPMRLVNHDSLEYIDNKDLFSIAGYIKSTVDPNPKKALASDASQAQQAHYTYSNYCAGCHDVGAGGAPKMGDPSIWQDIFDKTGKDQLYVNAINGYQAMPARGLCISDQDVGCSDENIRLAVDYILEQSLSAVVIKKTLGKKPKEYSAKEGAALYTQYCSSCHSKPSSEAPQIGDEKAWKPLIRKGIDNLFLASIFGQSKGLSKGCKVIKGNCETCSDAEIIAAAKHLIQASQKGKDYHLW
jgi:cytochrome c5